MGHPVMWEIQGWEFQYKLRTLKLTWSDMVLGVNWMSQFGPITFDFVQECIQLRSNGEMIELKSGMSKCPAKMMGIKEMGRIFRKDSYGIVGQLCHIKDEKGGNMLNQVLEVIKRFPKVFEEPTWLPLPRSQDHHIPLKEGEQPFKIGLYRHPFIQNTNIKRLVVEMWRYKLNHQLKENLS